MFSVVIEQALRLHSNLLAVGGACENIRTFKAALIDKDGNRYKAHIPLGKTLVWDDRRILLGIEGDHDAQAFIGKTLFTDTTPEAGEPLQAVAFVG